MCRNPRIYQHRVFGRLARCGKTSTGWFFGFELHLVFNDFGELLVFMITPGNAHDLKSLPRLAGAIVWQAVWRQGQSLREVRRAGFVL